MKIGVLGTGVVGQTIGGRLVSLGHDVMMGARSADNEKVLAFAARTGGKARHLRRCDPARRTDR